MSEGESVVLIGMEDLRKQLRTYVDAAAEKAQHTVIRRHAKPIAVIVPVEWYVAHGGDPRGPLPGTDAG